MGNDGSRGRGRGKGLFDGMAVTFNNKLKKSFLFFFRLLLLDINSNLYWMVVVRTLKKATWLSEGRLDWLVIWRASFVSVLFGMGIMIYYYFYSSTVWVALECEEDIVNWCDMLQSAIRPLWKGSWMRRHVQDESQASHECSRGKALIRILTKQKAIALWYEFGLITQLLAPTPFPRACRDRR